MTQAYDWQGAVGETWADEWERTDRTLGPVNAALVDCVVQRAHPGSRILDVGCGAGATSLALAHRLPGAEVRGIDLSEALVAAATARNVYPNLRFEHCDAACWQGGVWRPDLLVSRHGVMFFPDPVYAFAHLAGEAALGARLVFSCFRERSANEWVSAVMSGLDVPPAPADPHAPGPFAFADRDRVLSILGQAGWKDAEAAPLDFAYVAGAGRDPVADALEFVQRIGPAAPLLRAMDERTRAASLDRLRQVFCNHLIDGTVSFHAAAWIWTARI